MTFSDLFWKRPFLGALFIASIIASITDGIFFLITSNDMISLIVAGIAFGWCFVSMWMTGRRNRRYILHHIAKRLSGAD